MEVFIRNLDPKATEQAVEEWLVPVLEQVNIQTFKLRKSKGKPYANLTVTDVLKARELINKVQLLPQIPTHPRSRKRADFTPSKHQPDPFDLKALRQQAIERTQHSDGFRISKKDRNDTALKKQDAQKLTVGSVKCGRWQTVKGGMNFVPFADVSSDGTLIRKGRALVLERLCASMGSFWEIIFESEILESALFSRVGTQWYLMLTLCQAPKLYLHTGSAHSEQNSLQAMLAALMDKEPQTFRESCLPNSGMYTCGACLVYQIELRSEFLPNGSDVRNMIPKSITLRQERFLLAPKSSKTFREHTAATEHAMNAYLLSYVVKFQLHALWMNAVLSPREVQSLLPKVSSMREEYADERSLCAALRFLNMQLHATCPGIGLKDAGIFKAAQILSQSKQWLDLGYSLESSGEVPIHRALVTPTGVYLYGPDKESANRVIRQYAGHEDCFLRVSFSDESGDQIRFDIGASNERILRGRFLSILQEGLTIAGEHFSFLGFSHSSLRSQSCWFMRPFIHKGSKVDAASVIQNLGDFTHIQCPAKCAARIGQAFSDTEKAMTVDASEVEIIPDVVAGRFTFTDGCGTISQSLCSGFRKLSSWRNQPTLFQIRYRGAKGMISLDTRLRGRKMQLRPSMIKFEGSPSNDIEICGANTRPIAFRLNHQIIKILEDLGVQDVVFEKLQTDAVTNLKRSATSVQSVSDFLRYHLSGNAVGIAELIGSLSKIDIEVAEDGFIRKIVQALIGIELRELKFRGRIPVSDAITLYGISDETGFLEEGQVYVTFDTLDGDSCRLEGRVTVTRSPALHPGDIQVLNAAEIPKDSPLQGLTNCIVFSQKGSRDVPSMLSGGDLDGDIFNIIYDADLFPAHTEAPAEYASAPTVNIGRSVTSNDMAKFFIDFMENDQLGRIATLHKVYADRDEGTRSQICKELAKLHSDAVDFSKSGQPVSWRQLPKTPMSRPDFMAPSTSTKVEESLERAQELTESQQEGSQYIYYRSERVIGKLFRSINEDEFFDDLENDTSSIFSHSGLDDVVGRIWAFVRSAQIENGRVETDWMEWTETALEVKEYYNSMVYDLMAQYAVRRAGSLTEQEVVIGTIVGRSGAGSKRQREQSEMMRARYKREVQDIRQWMKTQTRDSSNGYLCLATACLSLCVSSYHQKPQPAFGDNLRSFAWFAAAICVPKLVAPEDE